MCARPKMHYMNARQKNRNKNGRRASASASASTVSPAACRRGGARARALCRLSLVAGAARPARVRALCRCRWLCGRGAHLRPRGAGSRAALPARADGPKALYLRAQLRGERVFRRGLRAGGSRRSSKSPGPVLPRRLAAPVTCVGPMSPTTAWARWQLVVGYVL